MPLSSSIIKAHNLQHKGCQQLPLLDPVKTESEKKQPQPEIIADMSAQAEDVLSKAQKELESARAECQQMLLEAAEERENIISAAQAEAEAIKLQAQKEGYNEGFAQGLSAGKQESQKLYSEAEKMLAAVRQWRKQQLAALEPQLVELAVTIAKKFVAAERLENFEILEKMVKQALQQLQEVGEIVVHVHPDDMKHCREALPKWQAEVGEYSSITLLPDPTLERGDCRVESSSRVISCQLEERFAALREILTEVKANAAS